MRFLERRQSKSEAARESFRENVIGKRGCVSAPSGALECATRGADATPLADDILSKRFARRLTFRLTPLQKPHTLGVSSPSTGGLPLVASPYLPHSGCRR